MINSVTVYCASTSKCEERYLDLARGTGLLVGKLNRRLVYGGSFVGCMKEVAEGARESAGLVTGIIPTIFRDMGIADEKCDELIVTDSYRERKQLLADKGDLLLALPGGLGTLDELIEALMLKSIGQMEKPILILDPWDDYKDLTSLLDHLESRSMIRPGKARLYQKIKSLDELKIIVSDKPTFGGFEFEEDRHFFKSLLNDLGGLENNSELFDSRNPHDKRKEFNKVRNQIFQDLRDRYGSTCQLGIHDDCSGMGDEVDHLIPLSSNVLNKQLRGIKGEAGKKTVTQSFGSNHFNNFVLACTRCNAFKKNKMPEKELIKKILKQRS